MHLERNGESGLKIVKSFLGKMGSRQWVILLLLGLLLCVIALPVSGKKDTQGTGTTSDKSLFGSTEPESLTESTSLEKKLEELLSQVEGVGKVKVILMIGEDENCQEFYSSGKQKVTDLLFVAAHELGMLKSPAKAKELLDKMEQLDAEYGVAWLGKKESDDAIHRLDSSLKKLCGPFFQPFFERNDTIKDWWDK